MCTRCIRFMDEVAKDPVLDMRERGNLNEIIVSPGRELDGHYTFMTEHVCPVGALTTKDFRFKARVWFLRTAPTRLPGLRDGLQRAPRLRPALQQGVPLPPARQREGQQVLDVRRGDAHVQARRTTGASSRPRCAGRRRRRRPQRARRGARRSSRACRRSRVAVVSRAQHSLEDNWALRELARCSSGAKNVYWSRAAPRATRTTILIHRDKNPNTAGVPSSCPAPSRSRRSSTTSRRGARHARPRARRRGAGRRRAASDRAKVVDHRRARGTARAAARVGASRRRRGPSTRGTYVNAQGMRQVSEKALEPQGSSKPGVAAASPDLADGARLRGDVDRS